MVHGDPHRPITRHTEKESGNDRHAIAQLDTRLGLHAVRKPFRHAVRHSRDDVELEVSQPVLWIVAVVNTEAYCEILLQARCRGRR